MEGKRDRVMPVAFQEHPDFRSAIEEYFGDFDSYFRFQDALEADPEKGKVIPGTNGLRKVRWPDPRRGKGKRSGLRVIYLYVAQREMIVFFDVYDKDEAEDLPLAVK